MSKWADYLIFKVCKDEKNIIKEVAVKQDKGEKLSSEEEYYSKSEVINLITKGHSFMTIFKGDNGWKQGKEVIIVTRNGKKYLKTERNEVEEDNLGKLPEYNC